jgi:hypothetical protein
LASDLTDTALTNRHLAAFDDLEDAQPLAAMGLSCEPMAEENLDQGMRVRHRVASTDWASLYLIAAVIAARDGF